MNIYLEPLKASVLTNLEFGQLMKRHLNDLATIDPTLLTDQPTNAYLLQLNTLVILYENGLAQVRKNLETDKISMADGIRDKAVAAFSMALKLYKLSDDPCEVEAARVLSILFDHFKDLADLNYEAESIGIDKLIHDLERENYSGNVKILNMGRYVTRMKISNENFKTIFGARMVADARAESYHLKSIRCEILKKYNDFTAYLLAMAKAHQTPLFTMAISLLNTARKYYSDLMARRTCTEPAPAQPLA